MRKKNPSDFQQDLREVKRKLEVHYRIIKTEFKYIQKLIKCIDESKYDLKEKLLRIEQKQQTLTARKWLEMLKHSWSQKVKGDKEDDNANNQKKVNMSSKDKNFNGQCNKGRKWGHKRHNIELKVVAHTKEIIITVMIRKIRNHIQTMGVLNIPTIHVEKISLG